MTAPTASVTQLIATADREAERAERLLKIAQVAIMANVSERTVWYDIAAGLIAVERQKLRHRHRNRVRLSEAKRYAAGKKDAQLREATHL